MDLQEVGEPWTGLIWLSIGINGNFFDLLGSQRVCSMSLASQSVLMLWQWLS